MQKSHAAFLAIAIFVAILYIIQTIRSLDKQFKSESLIYKPQKDLISWKVPEIFDKKVKIEDENDQKEDDDKKEENEDGESQQKGKKMTRQELGRHGWSLLHMMGITYPEEADEDGQFYPCKECGGHFLQMTKKYPFKGKTRDDFMQYLCFLHNNVNERLEKPLVDCKKELYEIWIPTCGCEDKDRDDNDKIGIN